MCGIVGAVSTKNIVPVLLEGLRRLEYRGYDSCGVAVHQGGQLKRARSTSRVAELEANVSLRSALQRAIAAGLPTYAECGGLMYLARSITWKDQRAQMVGAIPGDVLMHARPVGRGYVRVEETGEFPWQDEASEPMLRLGHEFHHSNLQNLDPEVQFAYRVQRGHGIDGLHDGVMVNNLLASYTHLRHSGGNDWPRRFIAFVRRVREDAAVAAPLRVGGSTWSTR